MPLGAAQYLAQGQFDMQPEGSGDRAAKLPISGRPSLPPEPQPVHTQPVHMT